MDADNGYKEEYLRGPSPCMVMSRSSRNSDLRAATECNLNETWDG